MALPTGTITMADVNLEVGRASTATTSLNDSIVRQTAASTAGPSVLSGTVSMNNLRGAKGTQVMPGYGGVVMQTGASTFLFGYNLATSGAPLGMNLGSFSPAVINLLGGQTITSLYNRNSPASILWYLYLNTATSYTGNIKVYGSSTVNDPWPTIPIKTFIYTTPTTFTASGARDSTEDLSGKTLRFEKV
jgi:hypothetical protein